ncbi:countin-1-like [Ruditapes philippinarum]|uniref:countin-1-like n=1 Tax=Ruditapes philippinarum TaxID=129788 RepID=UPI00295B8654|nr:countin-1-like [Ruditapes philippinarum]
MFVSGVLICLLVSGTLGVHVPAVAKQQHSYISEVSSVSGKVGDDDKCSLCIEFAGQAINGLLQMVLQVGVVDTCGDLCQILADKSGSQALGAVCSILCDIVGIKEFINIINKEDLDPIYYCELIPACPVNDNGDAKFTTFEIDPKSGPQGIFDISFEYDSKNGTGTGQILLEVLTVDKIPIAQAFLHELAPAGTYDGTFKLQAQPDPNCDPTAGPCEQWLPGDYTVKIALCNGECGSKHPHSAIYDETSATFTITDNSS